MEMQNKSGRRYDREFKENAVALVRSGGSVTQVARDLGVSTWSLGRWVRGVVRTDAKRGYDLILVARNVERLQAPLAQTRAAIPPAEAIPPHPA